MYVDIIRSGVPTADAGDHRIVWGTCVSIAMSAQRRGWSEAQFTNEVARLESTLWVQLQTRKGRRTRSPLSAFKDLHKAWETAQANLRGIGIRSSHDVRDDALKRAIQWVDRLTDGVDGLPDDQTAVMFYVIAETQRRGMLRVTCPGRDVAEFAKLSHQTAVRSLKRLTHKGLLVKHYPGRGGATATGRAAIYQLADPDRLSGIPASRRTAVHGGRSELKADRAAVDVGRRSPLPPASESKEIDLARPLQISPPRSRRGDGEERPADESPGGN
jgi:hypothetical protein